MKKLNKIVYLFIAVMLFYSCNSDVETVAKIKDTNGIIVNIASSSTGSFLGSPEAGVEDLSMASVTISESLANIVVNKISGSMSGVEKIQLTKSLNGSNRVLVTEGTTFPLTAEMMNISDLLNGLGVDESDLRIGDVIAFEVRTVQNDGDVYYFNKSMGKFSMTLNCSYDLAGTYTMTNSVCGSSETVTISQNSDGTWLASHADGGLLNFCSTNDLTNPGSFAVSCGGIVEASDNVTYCDGYGIGCIAGGEWNQETGTLVLNNTNDFFSWADAEYTSTYVRN